MSHCLHEGRRRSQELGIWVERTLAEQARSTRTAPGWQACKVVLPHLLSCSHWLDLRQLDTSKSSRHMSVWNLRAGKIRLTTVAHSNCNASAQTGCIWGASNKIEPRKEIYHQHALSGRC